MTTVRGFLHPKTAGGASSLIPSPPWRYSGDLLTVEYRTDPSRVRELLPEPLDATSFVFAPITELFGGWAGDVLPILLATSLFAGILAFHNSANRYLFSLGREGLLPHGLTSINRRRSPWVAGAVQTAISVLLVMPFAVLGKDPVLTLFSWFSGVAVLGVMLLYFLISVSVVVFFRRSGADTRPWNTLIAPVLGALGTAGAIWLIVENFTTLIGGDRTTAVWLQVTVPAVLVLGVVAARVTRGRTATGA